LSKRKKYRAKELRHDWFQDWYGRQAERARQHREPIRRTLMLTGLIIAVIVVTTSSYVLWKGRAERRLAEAYDIFSAEVTENPPANATARTFKTEPEKYWAALEAYRRVSTSSLYGFSDYDERAEYYEAVCRLRLNQPEGQTMLEALAKDGSTTGHLARLALAEHFVSRGEPARAETLYRELVNDPGQLPKPQLQLGLARALALQGKKSEAVNLYLEVARQWAEQPERTEAIARLTELDPSALDQLPTGPASATPRDALAKYKKKS
jgi:tetratricopeptide (TPR) repeat protein